MKKPKKIRKYRHLQYFDEGVNRLRPRINYWCRLKYLVLPGGRIVHN